LDLTNKILTLMESDLKPVIQNEASNEIREQHLSAEKARRMLGWAPRYTLEEGLLLTIQWYQDFLKEEM
jgi:CDP-glucose 4,6-dehydratase